MWKKLRPTHVKKFVQCRKPGLIATIIRRLFPTHFWFRAVIGVYQLQLLSRKIWRSRDLDRFRLADNVLIELTRSNRSFPIQMKIIGRNFPRKGVADSRGTLLCGIHLPFSSVFMRSMLELESPPSFIIATEGSQDGLGNARVIGTNALLKAYAPGTRAMLRMRTALANGESVATMLDESIGGELLPHMVRLAGKINAHVWLCWTRCVGNEVEVHVMRSPDDVCDTEPKVRAALDMLDKVNRRELQALRKV